MTALVSRLRDLLDKATPRPWTNQGYDKDEQGWILLGGGLPFSAQEHMVVYTPGFSLRSGEDAALIVEAVNALPALLDRVEALETVEEAAKTVVRRWEENRIEQDPGALLNLHDRLADAEQSE